MELIIAQNLYYGSPCTRASIRAHRQTTTFKRYNRGITRVTLNRNGCVIRKKVVYKADYYTLRKENSVIETVTPLFTKGYYIYYHKCGNKTSEIEKTL